MLLVVAMAVLLVGLVVVVWLAKEPLQDRIELARLSARLGGPITIRRAHFDDADFLLSMAADADVVAANGWPLGLTQDAWVMRRALRRYRPDLLIAASRETGEPVGYASLAPAPLGPEESLHLGLAIHGDHRSVGHGRRILGAAILLMQARLAKGGSGAELFVGTTTDNVAIVRVMEQLGYARESEVHPYEAPNGEVFDSYWYRCGPTTQPPLLYEDD